MSTVLKGILLPALCVACDGVLTGDDRGLCGACRSRLVPISGPCCPRCGNPADSDEDPCIGCVASPPPQHASVLWGSYEGVLRRAVLALKHARHDELVRPLGGRLAARIVVAPWCAEVTAVTAVPSHELRRLRRGASAAGLLAAEVAKRIGAEPVAALRRHGFGRQAGRTRRQRTQLPRGSFSARKGVTGRNILIVDDVCTTGTTLRRAAETLIEAGAEAVACAALAHAPDPRRIS
jgi:predicted amidophosphoribosyltransferase